MTLDFTEAFTIDVSSQCTLHLLNESSSLRQSLITCTVSNNGLTSVDGRLVVDLNEGLEQTNISIGPGETGAALLELVEGEQDMNETLAWTMLVTNGIGGQKILEMGQIEVVRTMPTTASDVDNDQVANEGSGALQPVLLVVLIVALLGVGGFFYRKKNMVDDVEKFFEEPLETIASESVTSESTIADDVMTDAAPVSDSIAPGSPPVTAQPTSVDQHGFEWYSTAEGHWYRPAGSGADWIAYEA